ncbi:MAG: WG repeat-containing protein [Dysgonamonadaceae bacterium]|jgi:hypothetical protein|nr:WG repeat-containing protein [Dysgonamonadaceae bacterium]
MKKVLFLAFFALIATTGFAQEDKAVKSKLEKKYGSVVYHDDVDGEYYSVQANYNCKACKGVCDLNGNEIIPPIYDNVVLHTDYYWIELNGKRGACDLSGNEVIPCKYDGVVRGSSGVSNHLTYFRIKLGEKAGICDLSGNEIIPCKYDDVDGRYLDASGRLTSFCVRLGEKVGICDLSGNEIIPCKYDNLRGSSDGLIAFNVGGKFFKEKYKDFVFYVTSFSGGKWGYMYLDGSIVIPAQYDDAQSFNDGLANVKNGDKWGAIDEYNTAIIPFQYDNINRFSENRIAVEKNGKWGYIDRNNTVVVPFQYDNGFSFYEGLARVYKQELCGYIDKQGNTVIPLQYNGVASSFKNGITRVRKGRYPYQKYYYLDKNGKFADKNTTPQIFQAQSTDQSSSPKAVNFITFSVYAKFYVQEKIKEWQKKGEFEKTADWQVRVNEATHKAKATEFLKQAKQEYIAEKSKGIILNQSLGDYDADNEVFLIKDAIFGNLLVSVPFNKARDFKDSWSNLTKTPRYFIENDKLAIAEITYKKGAESYMYSNQVSLNYTIADIDYNFESLNLDIATTPNTVKGKQNISANTVKAGTKSDVDINIPTANVQRDKTFAIVIANESYQRESQVEFARNDGETFRKYCVQTLGLPEKNVHYTADATLNNIRAEINWLGQVANAYTGEANIIFYYAGHGIPDESSKTAYLLPIDGYGSDVTTGYKLHDLYQKLGDMPAKSVAVFMDACFSGAQRSGAMLASARGVAIKTEQGKPSGNTIVFSAAQGDETAYPYREKGHGLFTYFLLKKLQETKGDVTLGELDRYIATNVRQQSIVVNSKSQTPTVIPSASLVNWQGMRLK